MPISSPKNSLLQEIRKAAAMGRPTDGNLVVAEGPHLLQEAMRGAWKIAQVLVAESYQDRHRELLRRSGADVIEVSERAFAASAATQNHQGLLTLLHPARWSWPDLTRSCALLLVFDGIQDPGNAGTLIRSAEAFGATGVVFLSGSVHVANGKLLRAAAGSAFRVPILEDMSSGDLLMRTTECNITLYALSASARQTVFEAVLTRPSALILGSEGAGVSSSLEKATQALRIPVNSVESLNVGIAGSIALFEAARQRNGWA